LFYLSFIISHTATSIAIVAAAKRNASVPAGNGIIPIRERSKHTYRPDVAAIARPKRYCLFTAMNTAPAAMMTSIRTESLGMRSGPVTGERFFVRWYRWLWRLHYSHATRISCGKTFFYPCYGQSLLREQTSKTTGMKRLYRSKVQRMLGGVCGGIGEHLDVDPTVIRLVWAVMTMLSVGIGIIAYIVAWIIVPEAETSDEDPLTPVP
jgi:phage shock protein C